MGQNRKSDQVMARYVVVAMGCPVFACQVLFKNESLPLQPKTGETAAAAVLLPGGCQLCQL